jgi:hypothetical protein
MKPIAAAETHVVSRDTMLFSLCMSLSVTHSLQAIRDFFGEFLVHQTKFFRPALTGFAQRAEMAAGALDQQIIVPDCPKILVCAV